MERKRPEQCMETSRFRGMLTATTLASIRPDVAAISKTHTRPEGRKPDQLESTHLQGRVPVPTLWPTRPNTQAHIWGGGRRASPSGVGVGRMDVPLMSLAWSTLRCAQLLSPR